MPIPILYRKSSEAGVASYDFFDLASGQGIVTIYGGAVYTGVTTKSYLLTSQTFYSDDVVTSISGASYSTATKALDIDFDMSLNRPLTIKGNAIVNIPIGIQAGSGDTFTINANAILRRWDGTTETDIITASGAYLSGALITGDYLRGMTAIKLNIPQTHFKAGETLRLTAEIYGDTQNGNPGTYFIGHDPLNRASTEDNPISWGTYPSIMSIQLPTKIDL